MVDHALESQEFHSIPITTPETIFAPETAIQNHLKNRQQIIPEHAHRLPIDKIARLIDHPKTPLSLSPNDGFQILTHLDLTLLALTSEDPSALNTVALTDNAQQWLQNECQRLSHLNLPRSIQTETDLILYISSVVPQYPKLPNPTAIETLLEAALSTLPLPDLINPNGANNLKALTVLQDVLDSCRKWSVMGFANALPADLILKLITQFITDRHYPHSANLITCHLFTSISQDLSFFETLRRLHPSNQLPLSSITGLTTQINSLANLAISLNPGETAQAALAYLTPHQPPLLLEIAEQILTQPVYLTTPLGPLHGCQAEFLGKTLHFYHLPQGTEAICRFFPMIAGAITASGEILELYPVNPMLLAVPDQRIAIDPEIDPFSIMGPVSEQSPETDTLLHFLQASAALKTAVAPFLSPSSHPDQFHPVLYYHLWQLCHQTTTIPPEISNLLSDYGEAGFNLLSGGDFSLTEISRLLPLLHALQKVPVTPPQYNPEIIGFTQTKTDTATWILTHHDSLVRDSLDIAQAIFPEDSTQAYSTAALLRSVSKNLLLAAADYFAQHQSFDPSSLHFFLDSLSYQHLFTQTYIHPELAPLNPITLQTLHQITQKGSHPLSPLPQIMHYWTISKIKAQAHAPYAGRLDDMAASFYSAYRAIESEPKLVTTDTDQEIALNLKQLELDAISGRFPPEALVVFAAAGNLRVEGAISQDIRQKYPQAQLIATDPFLSPPTNLGSIETYETWRIEDLSRQPQLLGKIDRLYALGSPLMELVDLRQYLAAWISVSRTLKEGGVFCTDNAFRFGRHSYTQKELEHLATHPHDPETVFYRIWKSDLIQSAMMPDSHTIGKYFNSVDPVFSLHLAHRLGLHSLNFPDNPAAALLICDLMAFDDEAFLHHPHTLVKTLTTTPAGQLLLAPYKGQTDLLGNNDPATNLLKLIHQAREAFYQTNDAHRTYNRWLWRLQKTHSPDTDALLPLDLLSHTPN